MPLLGCPLISFSTTLFPRNQGIYTETCIASICQIANLNIFWQTICWTRYNLHFIPSCYNKKRSKHALSINNFYSAEYPQIEIRTLHWWPCHCHTDRWEGRWKNRASYKTINNATSATQNYSFTC